MTKVKNRDRKQKPLGANDSSAQKTASGPAMEMDPQPVERMQMPSDNRPTARKKEKRFGHN
jgi:hypothetical protein